MKRALIVIGVVCVAAAAYGYRLYEQKFVVHVPQYPAPGKTVWLSQNWTKAQSEWFRHADQGTQTFKIPFEWFMALRQPGLFAASSERLADPAYLDRFGFIADADAPADLPLPIGFARGTSMARPDGSPWLNEQTRKPYRAIGLTCAGCHTGRITYKGTEILVDGGPAVTNLGSFRSALGISLFLTDLLPWRFNAFATEILGNDASDASKQELRQGLKQALAAGKHELDLNNRVAANSPTEGFSRLDALNRIGNQVFSIDLADDANFAPLSAPVRYPAIWDVPWFLWVQYNASIEQPMVRNAGEAMGVSASVMLHGPDTQLFDSSLPIDRLAEIEKSLAGEATAGATNFPGLRAPAWPAEIFGAPDANQVPAGAKLYAELCQSCHLAPVNVNGAANPAFWNDPQWKTLKPGGDRYLDLKTYPLDQIGTDPGQAAGMRSRTVATPPELNLKSNQFGQALGDTVANVAKRWYDTRTPPVAQADRDKMNGNRGNGLRTELYYKARPLDGIWATPPYLHNGSVPTVYDLLSPVSERPASFTLGNREYDPVKMGYVTTSLDHGFVLQTEDPDTKTPIAGNLRTGHEFSDRKAPGVIGRALSESERHALVEFLKTL